MAIPREHDVAIVSIFHIKNVAENTVACQWSYEVTLSFIKARPIIPLIEQVQCVELVSLRVRQKLLLKSMNGYSVGHEFDHRRVSRRYQNIIGAQPEWEACLLPDFFESRHQLDCHYFLTTVVICFDDYWFQIVGLERFVIWNSVVSGFDFFPFLFEGVSDDIWRRQLRLVLWCIDWLPLWTQV